jgi:translocation and assembly module TamA
VADEELIGWRRALPFRRAIVERLRRGLVALLAMRRRPFSHVLFVVILVCAAGSSARADVAYVARVEGLADDRLAGMLRDNSQLVGRQDRPPPSAAALRRRAEADVPKLVQILHDAGFWGAAIEIALDTAKTPAEVTLNVDAGPLYRLTQVSFVTPTGGAPPPLASGALARDPSIFGLEIGGPARGAPVIDAQAKILAAYGEAGYPFAKIGDRRVVVDDRARTMKVTYTIDAGPEARFGAVAIDGLQGLGRSYVEHRITWREGALYDQRQVAKTRKALVDSNLFVVVEIRPADALAPDGSLPITITVSPRVPHSVGVGADYSTSLGLGANAFWEDRNLFGNAERLRLTGELAQSQLGALAQFRRPDFLRADQDLLATADLADETPVAYTSRRARLSSGLEWRLGSTLTAGASGDFEHGNVTAQQVTQHYTLVGLPLYLRRDTTDSLLDPEIGTRAAVETTPYDSLKAPVQDFVVSRLSGSVYHQLPGDQAVLAGYARLGTVFGERRDVLPADKRLYAGGGGSIRGFGYQLAGPLDGGDKPLGGRSSLEFGAELRWKLTPTIGLVPFVDGGNVFAANLPRPTAKMLYGAGLGVRYYTSVGPIRLDLATPLTPRPSDSRIQVYIGLGQAF